MWPLFALYQYPCLTSKGIESLSIEAVLNVLIAILSYGNNRPIMRLQIKYIAISAKLVVVMELRNPQEERSKRIKIVHSGTTVLSNIY